MNFDSIEGLNEQDLTYLYETAIENNSLEEQIAYETWICVCKTKPELASSKCYNHINSHAKSCHMYCDFYLTFSHETCNRKCQENGCHDAGVLSFFVSLGNYACANAESYFGIPETASACARCYWGPGIFRQATCKVLR